MLFTLIDFAEPISFVNAVRAAPVPPVLVIVTVGKSEMYSPNVLAAFLYLNDNYVGGHTQFDNLNGGVWYDVKPRTGKLLIFSNREYLHHVSRVESGTRYVLSFWFNASVSS